MPRGRLQDGAAGLPRDLRGTAREGCGRCRSLTDGFRWGGGRTRYSQNLRRPLCCTCSPHPHEVTPSFPIYLWGNGGWENKVNHLRP